MTIGEGIFASACVFALAPLVYIMIFATWDRFADLGCQRPPTGNDSNGRWREF